MCLGSHAAYWYFFCLSWSTNTAFLTTKNFLLPSSMHDVGSSNTVKQDMGLTTNQASTSAGQQHSIHSRFGFLCYIHFFSQQTIYTWKSCRSLCIDLQALKLSLEWFIYLFYPFNDFHDFNEHKILVGNNVYLMLSHALICHIYRMYVKAIPSFISYEMFFCLINHWAEHQ
jgi:hypothetical protein